MCSYQHFTMDGVNKAGRREQTTKTLSIAIHALVMVALFVCVSARKVSDPATITNSSATTLQEGEGVQSVYTPEGRAIVDLPLMRGNETADAFFAGGTIAAAQNNPNTAVAPPSFYQPIFDLHNSFRARHLSTPAFVWNSAIASSAAAHAAKCTWGHDATNSQYGENLYAYSLDNNQAQFQLNGLTTWYNEKSLYNYNSPGFSEATGHFTQVVWKSSTSLGCAVQSCPNGLSNWSPGRVLLVCRYHPPGNFFGQFAQNVMPEGTVQSSNQPPAQLLSPPSPSPSPATGSPSSPRPTTSPSGPVMATVMRQGSVVREGTCLTSPNGAFKMCMQTTGQAQLLKAGSGIPLWSSPFTYSFLSRPFSLTLEASGRLSILSGGLVGTSTSQFTKLALWSANAPGQGVGPYRFLIQDDGNAVIYDSRNAPIWQSSTNRN